MKKTSILILSLLIILIFYSCNQKPKYIMKKDYVDKPAYGDMLVDSTSSDPIALNPVLASDSASFAVIDMIFNGLAKYDKDLNLVGDLASKWIISPDGKMITFYLKKGVKWQDGVEFTAEDVKFTYEKFVDPKIKTAYSSMFQMVDKVEIIDKYKFKVFYKEPFAPALETWGISILPKHLLSGKDFNTAEFNRNPVGTGPYKFKKWITAQKVELVANKEYFEGEPYIQNHTFMIIPDESAQFMNLQAGNIDFMGLTPDLYFTKAATKELEQSFNKYNYPSFSYTYIGYNETNPLFTSKNVRQALSYAINKDEIIKGVRRGLAMPITGPFIPGSWAYNTKVKSYDYDPEKAKKMLEKEGWKQEKDGFLYKDGKKFSFTLMTNQGVNERMQIATIVQQQFAKLGIEVNIRVIAWNVFIPEYIDKKKFEAVVMGWQLSRDPDCYDIWHSSKTKEGEFNFISYKNPEVDKLLVRGRTTYDKSKRRAIYHEIHKLIAEDCPYTFLYTPYELPIIHKRFHGIAPAPAGIGYNFIKWYVPAEIQKYEMMR